MHPHLDPLLLPVLATILAAFGVVLARWRDLGGLVGAVWSAALIADPSLLPYTLAVPALASIAALRGASRGVSRPELTWTALAFGALGGAASTAVPPVHRGAIAVGVGVAGVVLAGLALVRRSSVRVRPLLVGDVPVTGGARP